MKLASKPTNVSSKILLENLVAVHKGKESITLKTPAYVETCILDLSKTLMYDFHCNNDKTNKKVIGKLKDEACSIPINEFVGLRSKKFTLTLKMMIKAVK